MTTHPWIEPDWPAPDTVRAAITTRTPIEDSSASPYEGFNLATHVGDDEASVLNQRQLLQRQLGYRQSPQWLEQIHGIKVVDAQSDNRVRTADGCFTDDKQLPCVVMTADCLPVLICDQAGTQVAAVHAGWRSLAGGILREAMGRFSAPADQLLIYLGPAISQPHIEVGFDVLEGFYDGAINAEHCEAISSAFQPSFNKPMKFHADLYQLARVELQQLGVSQIYGGDFCTFSESERFYSYRRDGQTGRMATLIWLT